MSNLDERYLKIGLRLGYAVLIVLAFPAAFFLHFGIASSLFLAAALLVIVERWASMREAVMEFKGRSEEAIHLTAEMASQFAEQRHASSLLQQREVKFRKAFEHAAIGMAIVSISGDILKINSALAEILGFTDEQLKATNFETLLPEYEAASYRRELSKLFYGAVESIRIEQRLLRSNGDVSWVLWTASMIPAAGDDGPQYIYQFQDINDRKRAERQIAFDALHDGLTGLPNRTLFVERLQAAFRTAQRAKEQSFAVCYIDFDRFKLVNDSFGHAVGDKLLIEVAARLRSLVPNGDTIARLGGDEFAILIENIRDAEATFSTTEAIRSELARPFDLGGQRVQSTVSIGLAMWASHYEHPESILRDADTALSHAKQAGRDRCEVFSSRMREASVRFLENETDLRGAVERGEFRPYYQPIIDLATTKLAGFEALIRWEHPERGLISPGEFIEIAEETGLIYPIGEWMLRQTCRQVAAWQQAYSEAENLWVSVNVSAKQFMQSNVEEIVSRLLEETGIQPRCLKLELTESVMAENLSHVSSVMGRLKRLGVKLCIDDFGTGYSSLSNLHLLPLDALKVDRSFVNHMAESSENREIIKTIVSLAASLNLDVIAEGVETDIQMAQLASLKCGFGQGFFFSPPVDAAAAEALIRFSRMWSVPAVSSAYTSDTIPIIETIS